ncbi:MAG: NAD(P)-dependent glycerol-3-phosphate dehydrogenase [Mangrovicoccus sp.]|nr:NAD(P)-dependent glycerol-3-phosphate dehydrogenase [Mangrovicoccus sp.]
MVPSGETARPAPIGRIAVIGTGAWGTALAVVAAQVGRQVAIWGRSAEVVDDINRNRRNSRNLDGIALPAGITATTNPGTACAGAEAVLIVTPSLSLRATCAMIRSHLAPGVPVALCCKGIERGSGLLPTQVAEQELPGHPVGALSGPTFARETALGHPTAATIAFPFNDADRADPAESPAARLAAALSGGGFRPYVSDDPVGVEVGGAVKNVIAIACGMMTGAGFAENTRAALITRGLEEMRRLAEALGGRDETVNGLSGVGDLVLTCSSPTSRNFSLGAQLGAGRPRAACFDGRDVVVEGEVNALSVIEAARRAGVSMPICEAVHAILHEGIPLAEAFARLWARPIRAEATGLSLAIEHPGGPAALQDLTRRLT